MGVCGVKLAVMHVKTVEFEDGFVWHEMKDRRYCSYNTGTSNCDRFVGLALTVGYLLPISAVFSLYIVIYTTVVIARQRSRNLTEIRSTKGNGEGFDNTRKMRLTVPWCIIVLLALYIVSTLPWIPMDLFPHKILPVLDGSGKLGVLIDLMYSILLISSAASPLSYLLSSQTLKGLLISEIRGLYYLISGVKT